MLLECCKQLSGHATTRFQQTFKQGELYPLSLCRSVSGWSTVSGPSGLWERGTRGNISGSAVNRITDCLFSPCVLWIFSSLVSSQLWSEGSAGGLWKMYIKKIIKLMIYYLYKPHHSGCNRWMRDAGRFPRTRLLATIRSQPFGCQWWCLRRRIEMAAYLGSFTGSGKANRRSVFIKPGNQALSSKLVCAELVGVKQ